MPNSKEPDFAILLDEELKTCFLPRVTDTAHAETDAIIADIHCVLSGNGGFTKGLIFKTAATAVNVKLLKRDIQKINTFKTSVENKDIASVAVKKYKSKISNFLWDNKGFIFTLILIGSVYVTAAIQNNLTSEKALHRIDKIVTTVTKLTKK